MLQAFEVDNTQLGFCFSAYGIAALISYIFGGPLADKYPPRKLMGLALIATAAGGIVFASYPSLFTLRILYAYWGVTTIFIFWAPMIKATRVWGGARAQGKAFGFLDGGRGLVGALFGLLGVLLFSLVMGAADIGGNDDAVRAAFRPVIYTCAVIVALVGLLVWRFLKLPHVKEEEILLQKIEWWQIREVLRLRSVWLLMIMILCAYVGYKITDVFSLYASDVLRYDAVDSASVGTFLLFIRPVVGVAIGILADRTNTALWLFISFLISIGGAVLFATGLVESSITALFFVSTLIVATGVYAARSLYFAVMKQGRIPLLLTGTAVGLISVIGYTPDIFAGPAMGYLLDGNGVVGHRNVFWMLTAFAAVGAIAALAYYRRYRHSP